MDALTAAHDVAVQMIDTSIVRVHQHGACMAGNADQQMGRSRGGLTSKIHAVVDANGLPVQLGLTRGEAHDNRLCSVLLNKFHPHTMLLADRGYDADWIGALAANRELGPISLRSETAKSLFASARFSTERATWSSDFSTRSNSVAASPPATTNSQPTISPSSSSRAFVSGYAV
jgi:transposase